MDIRRFGAPRTRVRDYARVRALDAYSRYYDVVYPHEERAAGRPLRVPPAYERLRRARRELRREGRLGAGQLVRAPTPPPATRRCARAAGPGASGRRRSAPSASPTRDTAGALRPVLVRQARRARAGRRRGARADLRQRRSTARSAPRSTPSCSTTRGGHRGRPHGDPRRRGVASGS